MFGKGVGDVTLVFFSHFVCLHCGCYSWEKKGGREECARVCIIYHNFCMLVADKLQRDLVFKQAGLVDILVNVLQVSFIIPVHWNPTVRLSLESGQSGPDRGVVPHHDVHLHGHFIQREQFENRKKKWS